MKTKSTVFSLFLMLPVALLPATRIDAAPRPDIVLADFEGSDYGEWQVEGEAFGTGPAKGKIGGQQDVTGFTGKRLVNTYYKGDGTRGTLTSPQFVIERGYLVFQIGGGRHPGDCCLNLRVDGQVVDSATGEGRETLDWKSFDLSGLQGRKASLRIVDDQTGGWGHVNVDHILMTDHPKSPAVSRLLAVLEQAREGRPHDRELNEFRSRHPDFSADIRKDLGKNWKPWVEGGGPPALTGELIGRVLGECGEHAGDLHAKAKAALQPGTWDLEYVLCIYQQLCGQRHTIRRAHMFKQFITDAGLATPELDGQIEELLSRHVPPDDPAWAAIQERVTRSRLLSQGVTDLVYAARQVDGDGHWYANFGYWSSNPKRTLYHPGGKLCRLSVETGEVTDLIDDPEGGVRDPQLHYDGRKILFSYRKGGQPFYHLYEIDVDGTGLRRITDGPYDDIEPAYLPDGDIVFCSSRCNRMVNCYFVRVAVVYRCDANGGNLRALSTNIEQDNTPWVLPDGRILYQRWEYVDRSQVQFHHLWTMNPDGTGQMVYFGNMHGSTVMIDAKPIPGTGKVVVSFSPGHGRKEHAGAVTVVDPSRGPDDRHQARRVSTGTDWRDPYPLSEDCFLVARDDAVYVMDGKGAHTLLHRLSPEDRAAKLWLHEPRPVLRRPRERIIPPAIDLPEETGTVYLQDVYVGRKMDGVKRGDIKKLLVMEVLPKPVNFSGAQEPLSLGGTFTLERILGTVPVEADGSANFLLPAMRSLFFVALDEHDMSVKRMQSFMTVQPGERVSCVGCHEERGTTPPAQRVGEAMLRKPSSIAPIADVPDVFDFPRDIQPILDRHCVACHDYDRTKQGGPRAGGILLCGDRGPRYSHSYVTMTQHRLFSDGRNGGGNRAPRSIGSSASPVLKMVDGTHYGAKLTALEKKMLRLWIESAAAYPGTYAALGSGMVSVGIDKSLMERRCTPCHGKRKLDDQRIFNLSRAEKSLVLLAPLAPDAGGLGMTQTIKRDGKEVRETVSVFADKADPDYAKLLACIVKAKQHLDKIKRFDMPGFRPNLHYIREMQFYGILPADLGDDDPIDFRETDALYWRSHWYRPPGRQLSLKTGPPRALRQ